MNLQALKPGADTQLDAAALEAIAEEAPSAELPRDQVVAGWFSAAIHQERFA